MSINLDSSFVLKILGNGVKYNLPSLAGCVTALSVALATRKFFKEKHQNRRIALGTVAGFVASLIPLYLIKSNRLQIENLTSNQSSAGFAFGAALSLYSILKADSLISCHGYYFFVGMDIASGALAGISTKTTILTSAALTAALFSYCGAKVGSLEKDLYTLLEKIKNRELDF